MNNHKNTIFHQLESFLKIPLALLKDSSQRTAVNRPCCMSLALLGVYLKKIQFNKRHTAILWEDKIRHFSNHPYLCKGLYKKISKFKKYLRVVFIYALFKRVPNRSQRFFKIKNTRNLIIYLFKAKTACFNNFQNFLSL